MKRYLLFAHGSPQEGEASGGWGDCVGVYDALEDAIVAGQERSEFDTYVIDLETLGLVWTLH